MQLFIDTADIEAIKKANAMGFISGVTTNPSLIAKEGKDFHATIKEIASIVDGPISAEVLADDAEGMVEQGKVLNQELKHNIKSTVKTAADSVKESAARKNDQEELKATISRLTPEQLAAVKTQIERMQAEAAEEKAETTEEPAEEVVQEASAETENAEDTGSEEQAAE